MFRGASDPVRELAVCVFSGDENTEDDYARYVDWLSQLLGRYATAEKPVMVQVVDRGNPVPNAKWRGRIADAARQVPPSALYILVSDSTIVRGTARAIGWLAPRDYEMTVCASFDEAVSTAEAWRGAPLPSLVALHEEARG
ncbi:MAG: hypothetical protein RLO52_20560 [Sandaracinaceae bacterium]